MQARVAFASIGTMAADPLIRIDAQRRGGSPCVRDLRIAVGDVLGWLALGQTPEQIISDYPELTTADILACAAKRES